MPSEDDAQPPVSLRDPVWGSRTALVTIVEFADFECPYCARAIVSLKRIRQEYGPDAVRIVWKNYPLPFHPNARAAAEAAYGVFVLAGNDAFWAFHDRVFAHQGSLTEEDFGTWAEDAGVTDRSQYTAALQSHRWAPEIEGDVNEATAAGVEGTPSFFVNGVSVQGAQPFEVFKKKIDQELQKARAKIASGTAQNRVYAEMSKENTAGRQAEVAEKRKKEDDEAKAVFKIPLGASAVRGTSKALVTIVEFSDFQCPYCERVEATLQAIRAKYGDAVRLVWKNEPLPFHPAAELAAEAAAEVRAEKGDAAFWAVHDKFFGDQTSLMNGSEPDTDAIVRMASETGASAERIKKAIAGHTHKKEIDDDEDLAEDFQANGTPHFFINGRRLVGAQPEEKFDVIIDEEIKKAQDLIAKGTLSGAVYEAAIKDGQGPPQPDTKDLPQSLPPSDPARGNPTAKVTIHQWADFQCPFCGRVESTVEQLLKDYGGRIRFVWHDLPLPMHPDARLAAEASREAYAQKGSSAFWAIHDKMLSRQQNLKRQDLDDYARELNLNMDQWNSALDSAGHSVEITADEDAARGDGISGTPAFLIVARSASRGYFVNGAQSYTRFRRLIERALAESK